MNFELSKEQVAIQRAAWEFAQGEFGKDVALDHELNHRVPREIWRRACDLGLIGINYPEELGGQGYGLLERVLVTEQFCRRDVGLGIAVLVLDFGTGLILKYGSQAQKEKYVVPVAAGKAISGGAFTEPAHGSDITRMETMAVKDSDEWVINGSKMFISNGCIASFLVVLCQTDPAANRAYRGMSTIIVETDRPGFEATEMGEKMGLKMTSTAQIALDSVRVPLTNLVGVEGRGAYHALELFDEMRVKVAARAIIRGFMLKASPIR